MPDKILVATPDPAFGELLRVSLAENGGYSVHLVRTGSEVLSSAAESEFALAILDTNIADEPFVPLAHSLQTLLPGLRLMVIPPDNDPQHPVLSGLSPQGYLYQPFYWPDLLETVQSLLASRTTRTADEKLDPLLVESGSQQEGLNWVEDAVEAEKHLARQLLKTAAQAALITYQGKVWASTGRLGHAAVQETADSLPLYWEEGRKVDLARFIRLEATSGAHLVYTTRLLDELALVLIYEGNASLTRAHSQAAQMAAALASLVTARLPEKNAVEQAPVPKAAEEVAAEAEGEDDSFAEEAPQIDLSVLLAGMPSPDPDGKPLFETAGWIHEEEEKPGLVFPWETAEDPQPIQQEEVRAYGVQTDTEPEDLPDWLNSLMDAEPATTTDSLEWPADFGADQFQEDLVPFDPLERAAPAFGDQVHTCILLPWQPQHYLTGELADQLSQWFPQFCLAFGWRLEGLSIRPEYLQFSVRVAPTVSTGNVLRILRQHTSEKIFSRFPQYQSKTQRVDFWAPGSLVTRGLQPPQAQQLRNFIRETRQRQGF